MNPKLLMMLAGTWLGTQAIATGAVADTGPISPSSLVLPVEKTIRGVVRDTEDGQTIPGVNVMQKGTQNGTVTDMDGAFQLTIPDDASTLVVSFVGYLSKEVSIGNQSNFEISLEQDVQNLDEVVVVGYGTARKRDLTGAVSRVGEEGFNKGVNVSPDQLIQGKVAGVDIINNSGAPGGQVTFRIRGTSSVRSGNQPLFVVDGVPLDGRNTKPGATAGELGSTEGSNPLNFINPNDIESIDVLKDASATAIYGSRGANGVVIITTKKGKSGAPKVTVDMSTAVSTMVRRPDIMDGDTYRQALQHRGIEGNNGGDAVDAFDEITQTALTNRLNLSVSGGGEKNNYRLSLGYHDQEGVVKESGLTKYTASYTTSYRFLPEDRVTLDVSLIASNTVEQGAPIAENSNVNGSLIGNAIEWNPTVPFRYADGAFVQRMYDQEGNEVAGLSTNPAALLAYYNDKSNVTNILGNVALTVNIIDGLDYRFSLGVNHAKGNRTVDTSGELFLSTITDLGLAISNTSTLTSQTLNHTLNYKKELGNVRLNALLGYEFQDYKSYVNNISARGFTSFDVLGTDILQNPSRDNVGVSSFRDPTNQLQSFFGRINLNFSDRFLLTGTMRADGSTKFGENNKYGYFPSFAGAWVLSEEGFLKSSNFVDNLKFRVGWGITGNQEFPAGASQERYAFGNQQISLINVANPDLKWETTETVNIGLDFSLFRSKLMGSLEYFDKATTDLLFQLPTIQPAPAAQFWTNVPATVSNRGVELMLSTVVADSEKLLWEVGMNATYLSNELTDYDGAPVWTGQINGNGLGGGSNSQQLVNDHPLNVFKMLMFEGFDEDGAALYSDQEEFVGDPNPNFLLGVNTRLDYGKFGFNMSLNGAFGHQIYNNTANAYLTAANFGLGRNSSPEIGLGNESLANANVVSTRFLEEGNFLRLQNASVSYNLGAIGNVISNLRFSLTGQNLFLITNYSGFDPEVNTNRAVDGVPSYGIEYAPYPRARTFLLGVSASF
ncbi:SusC/RagA family TonB-linked outer membrane protein [Echinicola strongylocentroti]|uniref:SusC/RagA family TonB-linked outer membrane protein n=1 Tax=Echinicola strongylocentroti TaxID=1795355 RepID=A0A2Z4IKH5_9BACT|nr:TonB-dependent receptor [Echinicola strongylocentroti]AWW31200.1 SusC/RagA family TonB-linked outer membrane protein [Echinicola strongylocentroti]